jgi:tRNA modification GTPase
MSATYCTCLTPAGTGAIATLAIRGPLAWSTVRDLSERPLPDLPQLGRFWLTRLGDADRGEADDVVVAAKSLSPAPSIELHCHGGLEVIRFLEELLSMAGIEVVDPVPDSWFGDPLQAAALKVLTHAPTCRTAGIALDQYQGAFARVINAVQEALQGNDTASADRLLGELERWGDFGSHLATPWRVVIAGASNVGKSCLVNAVAGYQRAVVSPIPGTTRDVVTTLVALDGWPVELGDTAGWRVADSALEREGIARARQTMDSADLCLWLLDGSAPPIWPDPNLGDVKFVINKIDLTPAWSFNTLDAVPVSAQTGTGVAELCQAVANWLVPEAPGPGAAVPFTSGLAAVVTEARALIHSGQTTKAIVKLEDLRRECN